MIKSMALEDRPHGRRAAARRAVPHGQPKARSARRSSSMDMLEAVIGLGAEPLLRHRPRRLHPRRPRRASPTSAGARCCSSTARRCSKRGRNQNTLEPEHVEQHPRLVPRLRGRARRRHVVTLDEIARARPQPQHPALRRAARPTRTCSPWTRRIADLEARLRRASSGRGSTCSELLRRARAAGMSERITQQQLESYLWGAATLLRGTDRRRRLQAVHLPAAVLQAPQRRLRRGVRRRRSRSPAATSTTPPSREPPLPDPRRRPLAGRPHGRQPTSARRIQQAMRAIETANPDRLYGIFGDAQWTNKERLPDATLKRPDRALLAR